MALTSFQSEISYAFDEIAPPSTSASVKSSTTLKNPPTHVFINHRGPDVKETLAAAIYQDLSVTGLSVFLDTKGLELGDFLPEALQKAMSSASLHVAIFSPTYAQSPWCLAELSFMLQTGKPIIPVFYGVQPTDLKWVAQGKGLYAAAFREHEEKSRYSAEKIKEWKMSLHQVAFYKGEIINNKDEEQTKLKNIVNRALKEMKLVGFVATVADIETPAYVPAKDNRLLWLTSYILSLFLLLFSTKEKFQSGAIILDAENYGVHRFPVFLSNTKRPLLEIEIEVFVVKWNDRNKLPALEFSKNCESFSRTGISDRNLSLTMENLRVLESKQSALGNFRNGGPQIPDQSKVPIISFCSTLQGKSESIEHLKYIQEMALNRSTDVKRPRYVFRCLQSLDHLQLKSCVMLSSPSLSLRQLTNLRHLNLTSFNKLEMFPDDFKELNLLNHLNSVCCSRSSLRPQILQNMTAPEHLNFSYYWQLKDFPSLIANQAALKESCSEEFYLWNLPMDICQFRKFRSVRLQALPNFLSCDHSDMEPMVRENIPWRVRNKANSEQMQHTTKTIVDVELCIQKIKI